ncbi:MAG: sigma-70 family RNA polymerase sigma factor [bacterium]|nr:sigma-70 family RNA polymerase sigma factor [bacterium]
METRDRRTDEEIVEVVRNRDQELYREIVLRYEQKLRRYAMVFVRDADRAEDVVQNALIKAFINLHSFNTKKKFSSWLYRITHNEAINYIKKHKREISIDDAPEIMQIVDGREGPVEEMEREEVRKSLREKMDQLPHLYREAFELYYIEERSYDEICDILRLPMGTVGTRIARGRALLKKLFQ